MDNSNSEEASSENRAQACLIPLTSPPPPSKKKRNQPGNPDPEAEVVALSPKSLMATNRYVCETCNKGFQRVQNLQLHKRGHNLPWKLVKNNNNTNEDEDEDDVMNNNDDDNKKMMTIVMNKNKKMMKKKKRVYVCPEASCVHHHPSRALGDLTGIKKHYFRKHGEKKWMCEKCSKSYAVYSDWKAHVKTCGTKEYRCHCGILFARKDSLITHRAFCDALAEESARLIASTTAAAAFSSPFPSSMWDPFNPNPNINLNPSTSPSPNPLFHNQYPLIPTATHDPHPYYPIPSVSSVASATPLLCKASTMGPTLPSGCHAERLAGPTCSSAVLGPTLQIRGDRLTRDFLGVAADDEEEGLTSLTNFLGFGFPTEDECPCLL